MSAYRLRDRVRNERIRVKLGIFSVNLRIEERKQKWIEHIYRMVLWRLMNLAVDYKPVGRRSVGRDGCSEEMTTTKGDFRRKAISE